MNSRNVGRSDHRLNTNAKEWYMMFPVANIFKLNALHKYFQFDRKKILFQNRIFAKTGL